MRLARVGNPHRRWTERAMFDQAEDKFGSSHRLGITMPILVRDSLRVLYVVVRMFFLLFLKSVLLSKIHKHFSSVLYFGGPFKLQPVFKVVINASGLFVPPLGPLHLHVFLSYAAMHNVDIVS